MKHAVEATARAQDRRLSEFAVWADYTSISQRHPQLQVMAISSLPVYAAHSDIFLAVAPDAKHHDLPITATLGTYCKRGWYSTEAQTSDRSTVFSDACVAPSENHHFAPLRRVLDGPAGAA